MSTIASPRPSISISSRRTSTSTDAARSPSTSRPPPGNTLRRNRAALRDYYGLKHAAPADARDTPSPVPAETAVQDSELDRPGFDAHAYVQALLAREGLEGVMKVEASLLSETRSLDGEKKALVYDNYSKLIAATETIRKMREKMDPLTQSRSLVEDVGSIAERAAILSSDLRQGQGVDWGDVERKKQQAIVRWVLDAPKRLERLQSEGKAEEAEAEWKQVSSLLDKWEGVKGVEEVRQACQSIMHEDEPT